MRFAWLGAVTLVLSSAACDGGDHYPATSAPGIGTSATPTSPAATLTASPTSVATPATPTVALTATPAPTSAPATPTPAPPTATRVAQPAPTQAPAPAPSSITVKAENLLFDRSVIRARAGVPLTATLQNNDAGVDHNLTFSLPGLGHPTCTGPCTTTQTFTPPTPGTFSFFCTLHGAMFGDFIVE